MMRAQHPIPNKTNIVPNEIVVYSPNNTPPAKNKNSRKNGVLAKKSDITVCVNGAGFQSCLISIPHGYNSFIKYFKFSVNRQR